jgi:3-phenylpropionate/trans-cinnamate dioxygenase ferredoxin subunit
MDVMAVGDVPEGKPVRLNLGGETLLVLKAAGGVYAIGNQCTHQGASLDRGVVRIAGSVRTVTCPAHGSMFDLASGRVMRPPATKPVPAFDTKIENDRVWVRARA